MPTQAERRATTRRALLDAAASVFAERGYHGASLDAIAARAGLSKGSVYHHFASKHELFATLLTDRIVARLDAVGGAAPEAVGVTSFLRAAGDERWAPLFLEFVAVAAREETVRPLFVEWLRSTREAIARLVAERRPDAALPPEQLAILISALGNGMLIEVLFDGAVAPGLLAEGLEQLVAPPTGGGSGGSASPPGA